MNECPICGAAVIDDYTHLSWHATDEAYAASSAKAVLDLVEVMHRLNDRLEEATHAHDRG